MNKLNLKIPKNINQKKIENFFQNVGLSEILKARGIHELEINKKKRVNPYGPNIKDLYSLYNLVYKNKRTTVLEFGSGWSTLVIGYALKDLKKKFFKKISNYRRHNPFELFVLENEKKYLRITKSRTKMISKNIKINFSLSQVKMCSFNGMFASEYTKIPPCNPDFIYLDGPDQYNLKKLDNNFTTAHPDLMPMVSDILSIEFFLIPGTIIVVDGRGANANFLLRNFKRKWSYKYLESFDQHIFTLIEKPIGNLNKKLIKFYNKKF